MVQSDRGKCIDCGFFKIILNLKNACKNFLCVAAACAGMIQIIEETHKRRSHRSSTQ